MTREFISPGVSRAGLDCWPRRHGVSNLKTLRPASLKPLTQAFKNDKHGYVNVDIQCLPGFEGAPRQYLFVAPSTSLGAGIVRASRWVNLTVEPDQTATTARTFLDTLTECRFVRYSKAPDR